MKYDGRQNPLYPPKGYYASVVYRDNSTVLGSDRNWQSMILDLRSYYKLSADSKNVLAFWSYDWFILRGTPPYLDLPSSSWDEYANQGRGYIQSRFRGKGLISLESEYRFGITHNGLFGGWSSQMRRAFRIGRAINLLFSTLHSAAGYGLK